jgi:inosine-uridine nucleoside N-ribohydrolase
MKKIHLDTDIGGDIDDFCALAMLLKWNDIEIAGITTSAEENGRRAGYVNYILELVGRTDIPVFAGEDVNSQYRFRPLGYPPEEENWPEKIDPAPTSIDLALDLLKKNIEEGSTIVAIGPFTNLYLLEKKYPGILRKANLYLMGGYVYPISKKSIDFKNENDWNIQVDITSAKYVLENSNPTLIPLTITVETALKREYLSVLEKGDVLARLIVRQSNLHEKLYKNEEKYGIINFQHDPLAVAISLGWNDGIVINEVPLIYETHNGFLVEKVDKKGRLTKIITKINGEIFNKYWLDIVTS